MYRQTDDRKKCKFSPSYIIETHILWESLTDTWSEQWFDDDVIYWQYSFQFDFD